MNTPLITYLLRLADNQLICGHRLSERCGKGPVLEEDIATINIALDMLGQSRTLYKYIAEIQEEGKTEDDLVFLRDERNYLNVQVVELPIDNFADAVVRMFLHSAFYKLYYEALKQSTSPFLSALAQKSATEVEYHWHFSKKWLRTLGDGTEESHSKVEEAFSLVAGMWKDYCTEDEIEIALREEGILPNLDNVYKEYELLIRRELHIATLDSGILDTFQINGGKKGLHTEHMGFLLAEMQYLPRTHPNATW